MRPKGDEYRWSRINFDIGGCTPTQSPSVKSVGITGNMTRSRADILLFDDVEVPNNSSTDQQKEKLLQLISESEAILMPKPSSRIMFLGTPQNSFSCYGTLGQRGYKPYVWPSRYPEKPEIYEGLLAPELLEDLDNGAEIGSPTDTRFSDKELSEREASMGRSNYQLSSSSIRPFQTSTSSRSDFLTSSSRLSVTSVQRNTPGVQIRDMSAEPCPLWDFRGTGGTPRCSSTRPVCPSLRLA